MTARIATSWFGLAFGYFAALSGTVLAYQKLEDPLKGTPHWLRPALVLLPLLFVFFAHTLPTLLDSYRRRRLGEIKGELKPGYFRLSPRQEAEGFSRIDNKHQDVLDWLNKPQSVIMYLTGLSGSGKSSLLSAWVIPKLSQQTPAVLTLKLRGFQDPATQLEREIRKPGIIWQRPPVGEDNLRDLLERACKQIKPQRLLIVFDQFEEFVILQEQRDRGRFESLLNSIAQYPIDGLTVLLVLRSDYVGMLEELNVPKLIQARNWKDIPPFTESAAYRFIVGSGLTFGDELLKKVLKEAAEVEQTKGLIRPVTINLCGLVLERFQGGLPRGFRPGAILRGFLQETVFLPQIKEISPKVLPLLISQSLTKKPRKIADLAVEANLPEGPVRGCLRVLGMPDRGIVRPIDEQENTWEVAHDFLVPLLDSILARRRTSFLRRFRPWVPWLSASILLISAPILYGIAAKERSISQQVARSLQPIANIEISYEVTVPIDEPEMRSYRDRLMAGVKIVAKHPIGKPTKDGYIASSDESGTPLQINIPLNSKLMPRPDEVVPNFVLRYTGMYFQFYKNHVDFDKYVEWGVSLQKPDLSFSVETRPDSNPIGLGYNLNSGKVEAYGTRIKAEQKHWQSSGQIAAIPDLAGVQMILRPTSIMFPTLDGKDPNFIKTKALRGKIKLESMQLRIGSREFWFSETDLTCKQVRNEAQICAFIFPADLDKLPRSPLVN